MRVRTICSIIAFLMNLSIWLISWVSAFSLDLVKSNGKFTDLVEHIRFNDDGVIHKFQISKLNSTDGK